MVWWTRFVLYVALLVQKSYQYSYGSGYKPLLFLEHSDYKDYKPGCSYEGYHPGYQPPDIKYKHVHAQLQVDAFSNVVIGENFAIAQGISDTTGGVFGDTKDIALDLSQKGFQKVQDLINGGKAKFLKYVSKGLVHFNKVASMLGPCLGIFGAIFGAVTAVRTPTHEDILRETNKALDKMTAEVDKKIEEMRHYVDEKIVTLEKEMYKRRYTFLFMYWSECIKLETKDEVDSCQRESYRLIIASIDQFLLFHNKMDERNAKFETLSDDDRRRIEVGFVSFRNYALLALLCVNTVKQTYNEARQVETPVISCEELRLIELSHKKDKKWKSNKPKHTWYCLYKEELVKNARYYETYGLAALDAIKTVAQNRLKDEPLYEEDKPVSEGSTDDEGWSYYAKDKLRIGSQVAVPDGLYFEKRFVCAAKIHPSKNNSLCTYDVSVAESITSMRELNDQLIYKKNGTYKKMVQEEDFKTYQGMTGKYQWIAIKWCHARIQSRRKDYNAMEQNDITVYWGAEVMKVIVCGKLLAEGTIEDCEDETIKEHYRVAIDEILSLTNIETSLKDKLKPNEAEYPVDGLLQTTMKMGKKIVGTYHWWRADLVEPAIISQVHIYIDRETQKKGYANDLMILVFPVDTNDVYKDYPNHWKKCTRKNVNQPKDTNRDLRDPLIVKCKEYPDMVKFIKIERMIKDQFYLSEIKVYGSVPAQGAPLTKDKVIELENATHKPSNNDSIMEPGNAIDGLISTMSGTGSSKFAMWMGDLVTDAKIESVIIQLYGKYLTLNVYTGTKKSSLAKSNDWKPCGKQKKAVNGDNVKGETFVCGSSTNVLSKSIMIYAKPFDKGVNLGRLMIRKIEVFAE